MNVNQKLKNQIFPDEKRRVNREEFNRMTMDTADFFEDLEASRWTSLAVRMDVYEEDLNRQMTIDFFQNFWLFLFIGFQLYFINRVKQK